MFRNLLAVLCVALVVSGCANSKIANSDALARAAANAAQNAERSLDEVIHDSTLALAEALNEGLEFYAPLHLDKAKSALDKAKKLNKDKAKPEDLNQAMVEALKVEKLLQAARQNRDKVEKLLASALDHKAVLEELGTDKVLPKEYSKGMSMLGDVIRDVEGGLLDKVEAGQSKVLAYFNEIEADTLRVQWLSKAENMLGQAKDVDADDYAPVSFKEAERAFERADDFIGKSFRDRQGVKDVAAHAYNKAAKAYHLGQEVKKVAGKKEKDIEQYMLSVQQLFDAINQHAAVASLDSHSFAEQSRLLVSAWQRPAVGDAAAAQPVSVAETDVDADDASTEAGADEEPVEVAETDVDAIDQAGVSEESAVNADAGTDVSDASGPAGDEAAEPVAVETDTPVEAASASEDAATDAPVADDSAADIDAEPVEDAAQGEAADAEVAEQESSAS